MSYTRAVETPTHHLFAEMAAFPIASAEAVQNPLSVLEPVIATQTPEGLATGRLWRDAERHLLHCGAGFSVEELVALRDEVWFDLAQQADRAAPVKQAQVRLIDYVRRLSERTLEVQGGGAKPRTPFRSRPGIRRDVDAREALARRDWRWLTFALPADFLLAAHRNWRRMQARVDIVSPWLRSRLSDQGFAQSHVHMKGDFDFGFLWARVADNISSRQCSSNLGQGPGAELDEGHYIGPWLLRCMIARVLLAQYLRERIDGNGASTFADFVSGAARERFVVARAISEHNVVRAVLDDLESGQLSDLGNWSELQEIYVFLRRELQSQPRPAPQNLKDIYVNDPLHNIFVGEGIESASPEMLFVASACSYLESGIPDRFDRRFVNLFWQVVRIRNLIYRHVVQRPQTPGLQWFLRFYNRIKPLIGKMPTGLYVKAAAHFDGLSQGLRSLEVRTGLEEDLASMLEEIEKVRKSWIEIIEEERKRRSDDYTDDHDSERESLAGPDDSKRAANNPELGLVLHFIRDRSGGTLQGLPNRGWEESAADPDQPLNGGYRFAHFYGVCRRQALALGQVFRSRPELLLWVRGIDICTDELGIPTWVLRPLILYVRHCATQARDHLEGFNNLRIPSIRTTIHAGEDFVHLLTGLRSCEQTITHFKLSEGDRIGHGLALGVDPQRWSSRAARVPMTVECRLRDLVWELAWYRAQGSEPQTGRWHWVEEEASRLSKVMFDSPIPWQTLYEAHEWLINEDTLSMQLGFPDVPNSPAGLHRKKLERRADQSERQFQGQNDAVTIAYRYLTDTSVFKQSQQIVWVDHTAESEIVSQLQGELRKRVSEGGLAVEVNPTSNLLIGDFQDLVRHPLWRLKPPRQIDDLTPVSLCIGSDDPLNFATTLPEEFQALLDAAILAGLSHHDGQAWLEQIRQTGLDNRFTLPLSTPLKVIPVQAPAPIEPP